MRRAGRSIDLAAHPKNTHMKITYGACLKDTPGCRNDLIKIISSMKLQEYNKLEVRALPAPGNAATQQVPQRAAKLHSVPAPIADTGPTPIATAIETEESYHAESRQLNNVDAVCRSEVDILGKAFECIDDTGASFVRGSSVINALSHSSVINVLSHSVISGLGLMDRLLPRNTSFLTAAGKTEKPMGMLPSLPVVMGNLCLHIDCMVAQANN